MATVRPSLRAWSRLHGVSRRTMARLRAAGLDPVAVPRDRVHRAYCARVRDVLAAVAETYGYEPDDLLSACRQRRLSEARAALCLALQADGFSQREIARQTGRDSTTIGRICQRATERARQRAVETLAAIGRRAAA